MTENPGFCHDGQINSIDFRYDGRRLLSASGDCRIRVCDPANGGWLMTLPGHQREVKLWDMETRKEVWGHTFGPDQMKMHRVSFSADGKTLRACREDGSVLTWVLDPG